VADGPERIRFPDAPKTDLDHAITDLLSTAQRVVSAQGRLRSLLDASQAVVQLTDLPGVLRRIAEVALDLVDAKYAALGVLAPDGRLEQFIHVGIPSDVATAIGHLPEGHGILGALIDDPHPIRLEHLGDDPRSSGFPAGHPRMDSFLGVPIRVRDEVYGNIYVTERTGGGFTDEDQELLTALAATAGIAIDNARLLEDTRRRQKWSAATAEVTSALLSNATSDSLGFIADHVVDLADADLVSVVLRSGGDSLIVETSRGPLGGQVHGLVVPAAGTLAGRAMESGQPILADSNAVDDHGPNPWIDLGPSMAIPLAESGRVHGVLTVSRTPGRQRFTVEDMEMAADFAGQASVALALAQGREDKTRLALLEERGRIARDLHDHVIQRLFSAGLGLQALDIPPGDRAVRAGVASTVKALDDSIAEIRTAVFALVSPDARERRSLRHGIIDTVTEASAGFATSPRVVFSGALDLLVPDNLTSDILAVVRESLANVARHAHADEALLAVTVTEADISVDVTDDGVGIDGRARRSGTGNLERRAVELGGEFSLRNRDEGGTHLHWRVPLPNAEE
jgi:signal transduction histidine kinase